MNMAAPGPDFATAGLPERRSGVGAVDEFWIVKVSTAGPAAAAGKLIEPLLATGLLHPVATLDRETLIIWASIENHAAKARIVKHILSGTVPDKGMKEVRLK